MVKKTDHNRIEAIRSAALALTGRRGMSGVSVADIAREAGVSAGYLYRHYESKDALVNDLIKTRFEGLHQLINSLIAEKGDTVEVVAAIVRHICLLGETDEILARFTVVVVNDFTIAVDPETATRTDQLAKHMLRLIQQSGKARAELTKEDAYFAIIGVPAQYLAMRYNSIFEVAPADMSHTDHIVNTALNTVFVEDKYKPII